MKNYDVLCFNLRIQGVKTVQLIIYLLVQFLKTEKNCFFLKNIDLSEVPQALLACSFDKPSMKKNMSVKRW
jgi:hypothetical protein